MNNKEKISNKLYNHDSIILAITSFNCKHVLTVEHGYYFYWIRHYINGILVNNYKYFIDLFEAITYFNKMLKEFNSYGIKLKYNKVNYQENYLNK